MNDLIKLVTEQVIKELAQSTSPNAEQPKTNGFVSAPNSAIPVGVSARHIHLCKEHLEILFGPGSQLTKMKDLPQPGEFAAEETVTLVGPKLRSIERVRVLGDLRAFTQVEVSRTDAVFLGIKPMVRKSGDLKGTPGITIVGPYGSLYLEEGVIVANRHIHMNPADAERLQVRDNEEVDVRIVSEKPTILGKVQIRVTPNANLYMHIDFDDANSTAFGKDTYAEILPPEIRKCCWQG